MLSYRGVYRVIYETDKHTGRPAEFTFIPCRIKKGSDIFRYNSNTLGAYIPSIKILRKLIIDHAEIFKPLRVCDTEGVLLFSESMLDKAAKILKPITRGKNVSPKSKHNCKYI